MGSALHPALPQQEVSLQKGTLKCHVVELPDTNIDGFYCTVTMVKDTKTLESQETAHVEDVT